MSTLQEAIKEAYTVAPADKVVYDTLEIRQTGVQDPIYIVRAKLGITATDEDGNSLIFEPVGFSFKAPESSGEGFKSLTLSIDNVGLRLKSFIDTAKSQRKEVEAIYRPYLSDDLSGPQWNPPPVFFLKDIKATLTVVSAKASFMDVVNKKFPSQLYSRDRFPGLL